METKKIGLFIILISIVIGFIFYLFFDFSKKTLEKSCFHGSSCPMYSGLQTQSYLVFSSIFLFLLIGIILLFVKPNEKIIIKHRTKFVKDKTKKLELKNLEENEKKVIKILQEENGAMFQASLREKLNMGKVGLTRLLDKLEAKGLIERKRRGMNNLVVLKS